jgi:pimeloyl-ACP methyl ester carboxylesterase
MKKTFTQTVLLVVVGVIFAGQTTLAKPNFSPAAKARSKSLSKIKKIDEDKTNLQNKMRSLPILFEENKGQFDENVKFLSRGNGFDVLLKSNETVFQMPDVNCEQRKPATNNRTLKPCKILSLTMTMIGANTNAETRGIDEAVTKSGYFIGNDQSKWRAGINNYRAVRYEKIYQGIDVVFRGAEQNLEYDFHVAPEADPTLIQLEFEGVKKTQIDRRGNLVFKFKDVEFRHQKPFAYQIVGGVKQEINASYVLLDKNRIGFKIGDYDKSKELIIDPVVYASYVGGAAGGDSINDIAVDKNGNIYTASDARIPFPAINSTYSDILITKFNPSGTTALYSRYIGGAQDEVPYGMDVDGDGNVYVTGITWSPDFPMRFAEQSTHSIVQIQRDYMGFVLKLRSDGNIDYSTFLGGGCAGASYMQNDAKSIVADSEGNAYVTGYTCSANFPVKNGFQTSLRGNQNAFLTKYDFFGHISYSTYFGFNYTYARDIFTDGQGNAYISGLATAGMFTTSGAYRTSGGGFVAKFNTNAVGSNSIVYSTYLSGAANSVVVDKSGNAWANSGALYKLNTTGTALLTFVGANAVSNDIAIDRNENIYYTHSSSAGHKVVALRPDGGLIDESIFFTVTNVFTRMYGVAVGPQANMIYVAGHTDSRSFPTTPDAYQPNSNTTSVFGQGFFAKIQLNIPDEREPLIFVPGISGSWLDALEVNGSRTNLWLGLLQDHDRLTLDPNQTQANIIATDAIREIALPIVIHNPPHPSIVKIYSYKVYKQMLDKLIDGEGFKEYQVDGQPTRRTSRGCDINGQLANKPNLFVFAYDWRKSNTESAQALKDYVGCVRQFYPDSKINILAHSMGGLVARRYIISNPNDHYIGKMVTIASPWLGAPKAIEVLKTGNFGLSPIVWNSTIRRLGEFFKGMHELLPSQTYFDAATRSDFHLTAYGKPFKEEGWDLDGDGNAFENYDYDQTINLLNQQHPRSSPGGVNQSFHNTAGQDNWLGDTSGIKYFHIYGQQSYPNTPIQVIAKYRVECYPSENSENACDRKNFYNIIHGRGDKTVPTISAERSFGPYYNLLPRNDKPFFSPDRSRDESVEHNGLTQNADVLQEVINFLKSDTQQSVALKSENSLINEASSTKKSLFNKISFKEKTPISTESFQGTGAETVELPLREGYYVSVSGTDYVEIKDDLGNVNSLLDGGYMLPIPSVSYDLTGEKSSSISTPTEGSYTLTFRTGNEPIFLETIKGIGNLNPTEAVRYVDLNLPANSNVQLQLSSNGIADLRYDSDKDGNFETILQPSSHTIGNAAKDVTPPLSQINEITQPSRQLVINSTDAESGVKKVYYSFDGIKFREYLNPISISRSQTGTIYTFADDNSANRSPVSTYTFKLIPDPVVTITAPAGGSVFPAGTSVNFTGNFSNDLCNTHTAIWTFDNFSKTATIDEINREVTVNYTFASAGVYFITLTVNNSCGGTGTTSTISELTAMVVVYDPDGGFVTGGGWINSPIGAYPANLNLTGKASFGFNSKYQKGAHIPTGNTEFQFRVADFNFKSTSYDWLVLAGAKAQFKGTGTVNGSGNYGFMLTALDGQINGGGGQDKFRIKIWDKATGNIIYDNQLSGSDDENPTTVIGGGNIIIHKP